MTDNSKAIFSAHYQIQCVRDTIFIVQKVTIYSKQDVQRIIK